MVGLGVNIGDQIPIWEREGTLAHWNRFAAVNDEFAGHHMDDDVGRHEGFEGAIMMAPLSHAYLHALVRDWLADRGRIVSLAMRLKAPLVRGRIFRAGGTVTGLLADGNGTSVDLELWIVDDLGTELSPGTATVFFPAKGRADIDAEATPQ